MLWKHEAEVLVVGAGPVGLMSGIMLSVHGIPVEIIDQESGSGFHNYALVLEGAALELLDDLGLGAKLVAAGAPVERLVLHEDGRRTPMPIAASRTGTPILVLPPGTLSKILEERLHELKVPIHWNRRLDELEQRADRVSVAIQTLAVESGGYPIGGHVFAVDGVRHSQPRFVIGADGWSSIVRRRMAIDVEPFGAPEGFMVIDLESPFEVGREAHVVTNGAMTSVLWPLPGGRCRWTLQLEPGSWSSEVYPPIAQRQVDELLAARAPWFPRAGSRIVWEALLPFEPALAARFGQGRAWLAGDAAHVSGLLGIPALNQGLLEARDLASWIARALRGVATLADLDRFSDARLASWRLLSRRAGLVGYLAGAAATH